MTEEKKSKLIQYLTKEDIRVIHSFLSEKSAKDGEPIPSLFLADREAIDSLVDIPARTTFGVQVTKPQRDFSAFFNYASKEEKTNLLAEVVKKANEDQRRLMNEAKKLAS